MVGEEEGLGERGASQKMETDFQLQRWMCHTFDWESLVLRLGDPIHRGGGGGLVLEGGRQGLGEFVVAGDAVDARLDQNKAELRVLVLPEFVQVLAHRHSLLDEAVQVLRQLRGQTYNAAGAGR